MTEKVFEIMENRGLGLSSGRPWVSLRRRLVRVGVVADPQVVGGLDGLANKRRGQEGPKRSTRTAERSTPRLTRSCEAYSAKPADPQT